MKYSRQQLGADTGAVIPDADADSFCMHARFYPDLSTILGVFRRIREQVDKNLSQARRVAHDEHRRVGQVDGYVMQPLRHQRCYRFDCVDDA